MGLDLKLHVVRTLETWDNKVLTGVALFSLVREYALFGQLGSWPLDCQGLGPVIQNARAIVFPRPLPSGVVLERLSGHGYERTDKDAFDDRLTSAVAGELLKASPENPWNKAVWSFLAAVPAETEVVLYWC